MVIIFICPCRREISDNYVVCENATTIIVENNFHKKSIRGIQEAPTEVQPALVRVLVELFSKVEEEEVLVAELAGAQPSQIFCYANYQTAAKMTLQCLLRGIIVVALFEGLRQEIGC